MARLQGRIWDRATGRQLEARVQMLASTGQPCAPAAAIHKVGGGEPFFYSDGAFVVEAPTGQADLLVERGTEYRPLHLVVDLPAGGAVEVDLPLERWIALPEQGWYAGNTHVHYDERETRALDRLRLDPRVEDLPVLIVSHLRRRELAYASNGFPIGRHALSTPEHVIDIGEESRHNDTPWHMGLGHIMLINLERLVEPVSRGVLVDDASPVYLRPAPAIVRAAGDFFVGRIDEAMTWLSTRARFDHDGQRARMLHLFAEGRAVYERLARG